MKPSRRETLAILRSAALATFASSLLGACATMGGAGRSIKTAGLLPLSGAAEAVGQSMARAIQLAQPQGLADGTFFLLDTQGTPAGAAAAAKSAVERGAKMIIGPLFSAELPAVMQVVGERLPVIAFTNDPGMIGSGAFVFGITPSQTVSSIVRYVAGQGVRRIAVIARPSPWGDGAIKVAQTTAAAAGVQLVAALLYSGEGGTGLIKALKAQSGGTLPEAVLLPDGADAVNEIAPTLQGAGVALYGTVQWSGLDLSSQPAMQGALFAAPDPAGSASFNAAFAKAYGVEPGLLAGLAFDAALLAGAVGKTGNVPRDAILASAGYAGVTGTYKFNGDGSCLRQLAILAVEPDGLRVVTPISAV